MITKNYSVSMPVLYSTCGTILNSCLSRITDFGNFKTKYTAEFIADLKTQLNAAMLLPDDAARSEVHGSLRIELAALGKTCLKNWQALKLYIYDAWTEDFHSEKWGAAGWSYYAPASHESWATLKLLMVAGNNFITANSTRLQEQGYMSEDFPAAFTASMNLFNAKYDAFLTAENASRVGTQIKIISNNAIFNAVIDVCLSGQHIYSDNDSVRELFSFEKMSELVAPVGASQLIVTAKIDNMPRAGAEVTLDNTGEKIITDDMGKADFTQLAAGTVSGSVKFDGYPDKPFTATLNTGTTSRIDVPLQPLFTGEMTVGPVPQPQAQPQAQPQPAVAAGNN